MNALNQNVFQLPAKNAVNANGFEVPDVEMRDAKAYLNFRPMGQMGQVASQLAGQIESQMAFSFFKRDVPTVQLRQLRLGEASAKASTAQALREEGFVWLDFEGDVLNRAMGSLEDVATFLEKNERQGSPHAS